MPTVNAAATQDSIVSRDQFLILFSKQLQYQDPTSPTDTDTFLQQLAQFTTVEGIQKMSGGIDGIGPKLDTLIEKSGASADIARLESLNAGAGLLGLSVRYGTGTADTGIVSEIKPDNGQVLVRIGSNFYPISNVKGVANDSQDLTN